MVVFDKREVRCKDTSIVQLCVWDTAEHLGHCNQQHN